MDAVRTERAGAALKLMSERAASLLFHGGSIQGNTGCDAIAICGGRISAVGKFAELRRLADRQTRLLDLAGATIAPGFSDCHLHFLEAASAAAGLDLSGETSLALILERLREHASNAPPGAWIRAFGCDEALTIEGRGPSLSELDRAVPKNPLRLRHQTLHASWLNSRAIEVLGLNTRSLMLPVGAQFVKYTNGGFSGLVLGLEKWLSRRMPRISREELEARAGTFSGALARAGITSFTDAGAANGLEEIRLFADLVRTGVIRQRVGLMIGAEHFDHVCDARRAANEAGIELRGVKFMPTATQLQERHTEHRLALEVWVKEVERAQELGLACAFHATEVEELELALSTIEHARLGTSGVLETEEMVPARFRIEHGSIIPPNYLERLSACGAWVVSNPGFLYFRSRKYRSEPGLFPYLFPLRSLIDAGVPVAAGSDAPVTPARPLTAVSAAVTRRGMWGEVLCPEQALSADEALSLFTTHAAQLEGRDGGEIAVGKPADLIVLYPNPFDAPPTELAQLTLRMTLIGGTIVHEARG
jgi:predicted amidohydrolase YtcJ